MHAASAADYSQLWLGLAQNYHSELGRPERSDLAGWERSELARLDLCTSYNAAPCRHVLSPLQIKIVINLRT